ncbi:MAG TPA: DUF4340 domain-containing protein [Isosphaeraceae bacterium]|jgi:hypothetical protein|nr:DUF4340 domain-containing protein [Isosphaeraceae bacterium]
MTELKKTIAFVVVAVLLMGAAVWLTPSQGGSDEFFSDQGQGFFPSFKDPLACTSLEVIDYDSGTATAAPFKVMFKNGQWVIPSHHSYPADAKDRLAKTAAGVIDLKKDTIRSDRTEDHEDMGVIDPLDTKTTSLKGRGKRVTLRNKSDEVLADFIIGKEVPGRPDQRFVRVPDQKRTYGVNVKVDLSTRFADWIETNLLKLDSAKVRKLTFDTHKVIPEEGRVEPGELLKVDRKEAFGPWTLEKVKLEPDQEVNADKLSTLTSALGDLKIVGVRPKPAGLTQDLKAEGGGGIKLTQAALLSLESKGFYLTRDGRLLSNQGDLVVSTDEGIVYTLRFGEVVFSSGEELSAGVDDEKATKDKPKDKKGDEKKEGGAESRYLFVTVEFDPALIPPPAPPKTKEPTEAEVFEDPFQKDPNDPKVVAEQKAAKEEADRAQEEHDRKVKEGKDRAKELTDRFAAWYYVVPGDSFRSLMLDRTSLVRKKQENPPPGAPGAPPGGFGGLPPSFAPPPR